jgi:hypothetical protein
MLIGVWIGGASATLFALAVVSFADCSGPDCARERVLGVLAHAVGGASGGALLGLMAWAVRRLVFRPDR